MVCPSCFRNDIRIFYEVDRTPVQSCLLMDSLQEATAIPGSRISLGFCRDCGFIFNTAFNPEHIDYTAGYEDQQGFSPTFKQFMEDMVDRLIDKYQLKQKNIVEIGCGKGDFLAMICKKGQNRGVGIDPAFIPGRLESGVDVQCIQEFYKEEHGRLASDFICCRHTLEHIHHTGEFMRTLRNSIDTKLDKVIFFEVPDMTRILKEQAFWDIYYEHCSYFTPGSLARLFRSNGFEMIDLYTAYSDQYLFIEARPVPVQSTKKMPKEESMQELENLIDEFSDRIRDKINFWRKYFRQLKETDKSVTLWGAGSKAVGFLSLLEDPAAVKAVVDINPHLHGHFVPGFGQPIIPPDQLKVIHPETVIIMNAVYRAEISRMIDSFNLKPEILALE